LARPRLAFGRTVYISELYELLNGLEGIDYVKEIVLNADRSIQEISLKANELVQVEVDKSSFGIMAKLAMSGNMSDVSRYLEYLPSVFADRPSCG
jgi:hypothetical protein